MSKFENRTGSRMGLGLIVTLGLMVGLSLAVVVVIIIPAVLLVVVAASAFRRLRPRKSGSAHRPAVVEGEYEVLNSGTGKGR